MVGNFIFPLFTEACCELFYILLLSFLFKTEEAVRSVAIPAKKTKLADLILGCFPLTTAFQILLIQQYKLAPEINETAFGQRNIIPFYT